MTAPDESVTVPRIVPLTACAKAATGRAVTTSSSASTEPQSRTASVPHTCLLRSDELLGWTSALRRIVRLALPVAASACIIGVRPVQMRVDAAIECSMQRAVTGRRAFLSRHCAGSVDVILQDLAGSAAAVDTRPGRPARPAGRESEVRGHRHQPRPHQRPGRRGASAAAASWSPSTPRSRTCRPRSSSGSRRRSWRAARRRSSRTSDPAGPERGDPRRARAARDPRHAARQGLHVRQAGHHHARAARRGAQVQAETKRIYSIMYSERFESRAPRSRPASSSRPARSAGSSRRSTSRRTACNAPATRGPSGSGDKARYRRHPRATSARTRPTSSSSTPARRSAEVVVVAGRQRRTTRTSPKFEDFGDMMLRGDGGTGYVRVDWFTPDGLVDLGRRAADHPRHRRLHRAAQVRRHRRTPGRQPPVPRRPESRRATSTARTWRCRSGRSSCRDVVNRTETAMPQAHTFLATELVLKAQKQAQTHSTSEDDKPWRRKTHAPRLPGRPPARGSLARRLPRHRARLGARRQRAEQPHQRRRDRHRPHLARARSAGPLAATTRRGSWRSAIWTAGASQDAETLVNGYYAKKTRQAVRRRHRLRALSRAARQQGRRRGRDQHARSLARAHRHGRRRRPARTSTCRSRPR